MSTYYAEADALERGFWEAVGWCIQYKIKVYREGGDWRSLGELRDEISAYRAAHPDADDGRPVYAPSSFVDDQVQAYCRNGHRATLWGGVPMLSRPGEVVRWWGSPFLCHCGAQIRGGGWR